MSRQMTADYTPRIRAGIFRPDDRLLPLLLAAWCLAFTGCGSDGSDACGQGLTRCGDACVDIMSDDAHCGGCDRACSPDQPCSEGGCRCPEGSFPCRSGSCGPDADGDGSCDADDPCPADNPDDSDADGVCDSDDPCPLDNPDDSDADGVCDGDDPCPLDNPDDSDGDGSCDSADRCPGQDDHGMPVLANAGFLDEEGWTLTGGAAIDATAEGYWDPGWAVIDQEAVCQDAAVSQTVCVPGSFEDIGPLALHVWVNRECSDEPINDCSSDLWLYTGSFGRRIGAGGRYNRICLGEAFYSSAVEIEFTATSPTGCDQVMEMPYTYFLDDVSIAPADATVCPLPGTVLNGDFEMGGHGWTLRSGADGTAEVVDGLNNRFLRITGELGVCGGASATGTVSVPLFSRVPNAALAFDLRGSAGTEVYVSVGGGMGFLNELFACSDQWTRQVLCLGTEDQGVILNVGASTNFVSSPCADTPAREAFFDNLRVLSDPDACP